MIFFSVALSVVPSDERRRMNLLDKDCCRESESCSNRRSCAAISGPVMMKAEGILSVLYYLSVTVIVATIM